MIIGFEPITLWAVTVSALCGLAFLRHHDVILRSLVLRELNIVS